ncbi:hypothetical protein DTO166G4_2515 [Paecilomyces variotii]|nr:hypothetical protein DTO166G4_2515 [Paecilomyces variotii]KAJ9235957.1 hypothetical protein DTO166G5_4249 [Paecilomyces variotii]KAJ9247996.1 hypothetical protein DTO195F2_8957 [Paecilomyces variotii]KAJ9310230.1 hypothetical protein DTO217A2_9 [Paecilomyces variotii]KAJ9370249.1 hypothetical protein DTO282E5_5142 [Paecilomyces variotii]
MVRLAFSNLSIHDTPRIGNKQRDVEPKTVQRTARSKKEPKHLFEDSENSDDEGTRTARKLWTKTSTNNLKIRSPTKTPRPPKPVAGSDFEIFDDGDSGSEDGDAELSSITTISNGVTTRLPLSLAPVNSFLLPPPKTVQRRQPRARKGDSDDYDKENDVFEGESFELEVRGRASPIRRAHSRPLSQRPGKGNGKGKQFTSYREPSNETDDSEAETASKLGEDTFDSLADFIVGTDEEPSVHESVDESISRDIEAGTQKTRKRLIRGRRPNTEAQMKQYLAGGETFDTLRLEPSLPTQIDMGSPSKPQLKPSCLPQQDLRSPSKMKDFIKEESFQQDSSDMGSLLDSESTSKAQSEEPEEPATPATPPKTPAKVRLLSPSKPRGRIPESPHRESSDAFWSQEVIAEWNDQNSPKKEETPGRAMQRLLRALGEPVVEEGSPLTSSPGKNGPKSPSKTALKKAEAEQRRAVLQRKKDFDNKKASLAEDFFKVLDHTVSDGQIQKLAEETGGVKIIWSKTLQTTAGRANWKREKLSGAASEEQPTTKHHASIELAERVIDSEDRLLNTLAHEYCHLANFMISNVRNNPHGASFKEWGHKCTTLLKDHPVYGGKVEVTTKHSYKINYKYVWMCVDCGQDYGRHSKSIDPSKSRCGHCKGVLQQIKPKPRNVTKKKTAESSESVDEVVKGVEQVSL